MSPNTHRNPLQYAGPANRERRTYFHIVAWFCIALIQGSAIAILLFYLSVPADPAVLYGLALIHFGLLSLGFLLLTISMLIWTRHRPLVADRAGGIAAIVGAGYGAMPMISMVLHDGAARGKMITIAAWLLVVGAPALIPWLALEPDNRVDE